MATLKLTILKAKALKDGRHKIRIAVCHKQETSYIITRFIIDNLSQFRNGQVVKRPDAAIVNTKLRHLLNTYQERLDNIECCTIYSCFQIKSMLRMDTNGQKKETFKSICDSYIEELIKNGKNNYANMMKDSKTYFTKFTNGDILLSNITPELIEEYAEYLNKKNWSVATVGIVMRNLRTIINRAIKKRKVMYEVHPFIDYSIPQSPVRDISLKIESLNKILNVNIVKGRSLLIAKDLFSLSFYLGGINLIDLLDTDFSNMEQMQYVRRKIKNRTKSENILTSTLFALL